MSFSQSLNISLLLDCGASLSPPVMFDLCPTNPSVSVAFGFDEQSEFPQFSLYIDRMDFDAIFQQIIALYTSESRGKDSASRIFCVFIRPLVNFWQYFGEIPVFASIANPCSWIGASRLLRNTP